MNKLIDLSHEIYDGMITYKGLPAPIICDYLSRENSRAVYDGDTEFHIAKIDLVGNTGTYIDCPFHRFENGKDFTEISLENLANLESITIDAKDAIEIGMEYFKGLVVENKAVLIFTNWAVHWGTPNYFENHAYLTEEAAVYLKENNVKLVGIDSHNIDDTRKKTRPVHTILLGAGILIVEHLTNLDQLPVEGYTFSAVPPKIKSTGTFPVRAYAELRRGE